MASLLFTGTKESPPQRSSHSNGDALPPRLATQAQIRAIQAIAGKAGIVLASKMERQFGVTHLNQLTLR